MRIVHPWVLRIRYLERDRDGCCIFTTEILLGVVRTTLNGVSSIEYTQYGFAMLSGKNELQFGMERDPSEQTAPFIDRVKYDIIQSTFKYLWPWSLTFGILQAAVYHITIKGLPHTPPSPLSFISFPIST